MLSGTGAITFNGRPAVEYLGYNPAYVAAVRDPLEILGLEGTYDVIVKAHGGGVMGQAEAARLGISRALVDAEASNRAPLKAEGFMTRDPRAVRLPAADEVQAHCLPRRVLTPSRRLSPTGGAQEVRVAQGAQASAVQQAVERGGRHRSPICSELLACMACVRVVLSS
jgi:ribosomal protein S9